ncbi:hypothetical protein F2P47_14835 [Parvibaculum sedimenti]|uniref:Type II secretion system protein GspF domain-containing protein n=1 Tax=Parvibaculum sedimenti TaxID=2608632 RepID=A0A6N6VDZ3_9HYPH|nr:type II secretion system F family protein [Parvibaculum sedimenti]KAB7738889.1 hypothetical protein F2P47_14835 [Parvibaculum sedimenti]
MGFLVTNQPGVTLLIAALALIWAGFVLVIYAMHIRRQAIDRRVALVEPKKVSKVAERNGEMELGKPQVPSGLPGGMTEREQHELMRIFARWGIPIGYAVAAYMALRLATVVALAVLSYLLSSYLPAIGRNAPLHYLMSAAVGMAGWLLPHYVIQKLAARHAATAARGLPEALELLVICVEVGLALEDSIKRAAQELRHTNPYLAEELYLTSADLEILPSQDQALHNFAERLGVPSARSVVSTLTQTLRYGTPLVSALRVVAAELRNTSLLEMEERANKLPTLMTLPMILFIMPTIFLVVGGPAVLRVVDIFLK